MMATSMSMRRAQEHLLVLLVFLAQCGASWFTINGETSKDFSLCHRLGFHDPNEYHAFLVHAGLAGYEINSKGKKELKIYRDEWNSMINSERNKFEMNTKDFDMENTR